jgi:acetolactate synthase I/III small subunit
MNTQTLSLLLENRPGALARVVSALGGQGWNILSLVAAPSEDASITRATIVAENDADPATQLRMVNKLQKLIPTISAVDITSKPVLSQEIVLVRLRTAFTRQSAELQQIVRYFGAHAAECSPTGLEFEAVGCPVRIDEFVAELSRHGQVSFARSGLVALGPE